MPYKNPEHAKARSRRRWLERKAKMAADPAYRATHKAYLAAVKKRYYANNKARLSLMQKGYRVKREYRMTLEGIEAIFDAQGRACAICRKPESSMKQRHVDHDHVSGRVRGVLCGNCNLAIGHMADDPMRLLEAAEYLLRLG